MTETANGTRPLTPAEHRALAEADLHRMRSLDISTRAYGNLARSAQAHLWAAMVRYLDPDDVAAPEVRLPGGVVVTAEQSESGRRFWRWVLTGPAGTRVTAPVFKWDQEHRAVAAGTEAVITGSIRLRYYGDGHGQRRTESRDRENRP